MGCLKWMAADLLEVTNPREASRIPSRLVHFWDSTLGR